MPTFFTDADTAPNRDTDIARVLIAEGLNVVCHDELFPERTSDYEWLRRCGEEGWIAVTKDQRIRYCWRAKLSIMRAGAKLFVMIGVGRTHQELAQNLVHSVDRVVATADKNSEPFIARVYWAGDDRFKQGKSGEVSMWLTQDEWLELEKEHDQAKAEGKIFDPRCH